MSIRRGEKAEIAHGEICVLHSGLEEKIANLAEDMGEIKRDLKFLVTAYAGGRGFASLGRFFAVGAGVATPLVALAWTLWRE